MAKSFGERLRARRTELHLTKRDVADQLGISERMYSRYESDESEPERKRFPAIAQVLELNPAVLSLYLVVDESDPRSEAEGLLSVIESVDFLRNVDKARIRDIVQRALDDSMDVPRIAEKRAQYTSRAKILAAAGDKNDLELPENQRLLKELEDE